MQESLLAKILIQEKIREKCRINPTGLERYGRKVYSQTDEDGILEEIMRRIDANPNESTFIEIGVGGGTENNTAKLLGEGCKGIWIEGSKKKFEDCKKLTQNYIKTKRLKLIQAMVNEEHSIQLEKIIKDFLKTIEPTVLSIDIDGPDHIVVNALLKDTCIRPKIIIVEYNGRLNPDCEMVDDYTNASRKNIKNYMLYGSGASLGLWTKILTEYQLVACGILGINAFFVKKDEAKNKFENTPKELIFNHFDPMPWMAGGYTQTHGYPSEYSCYE